MGSATRFDVIIVGAGPVGLLLAIALADYDIRVAVIEARPTRQSPPGFDDRSLAISHGSMQILGALGIRDSLRPTPISSIHVSERGFPATVQLTAADYDLAALGYVVIARELGHALESRLAGVPPSVARHCPAMPVTVEICADRVRVGLDTDVVLEATLLVAADGSESPVRGFLGVAATRSDYQQVALTANIATEYPHQNRAFERFTRNGPFALLPLADNRSSLITTFPTQRADWLQELSDRQLLEQLQRLFGDRLGRLQRIGRRAVYPLQRVVTADVSTRRVVFVGNAATTVHPVAGQGFNLGLRDVATLAELIVAARLSGSDSGADVLTDQYRSLRRADRRIVGEVTHGLVRLFCLPSMPAGVMRNVGLAGLELLPGVKRLFALRAMGLGGRQTRLARGLPLAKPE